MTKTATGFNISFELQKKLIMKARELRQTDILGGKGDNCPGNVRYVWVKIEKTFRSWGVELQSFKINHQ